MTHTNGNIAGELPAPTPVVEHKPFPFIVGSGRSGTTLLRLMLDSHPDIAVPPETQLIPQVTRATRCAADPRETFLETLTASKRWPDFCLDEAALERRLAAIHPFDLSEAFRVFYEMYAMRFGKRRWGDQTPLYATDVALIRELFPEAHFIQLIRDGRDVVLSYRQVWFSPGSVEETARHWLNRVEAAQQARWFEHYLEVRYEDLVRDPETVLRRVCDFLDLPWHPAVLDYPGRAEQRMSELYREYTAHDGRTITPEERLATHGLLKQPPDSGRVERWRREMRYADLVKVEYIAGEKLLSLGYPLAARGTTKGKAYRVAGLFMEDSIRMYRRMRLLMNGISIPISRKKIQRGLRRRLEAIVVRPSARRPFRVVRFNGNPIVRPGMGHGLGDNINGPSLIEVPAWLPNPLGRYYLYFAHHQGTFIRLAYADNLEGPWSIYEPGTLHLAQTAGIEHIASPDVHVDEERREIRMYFHCPYPGHAEQQSFVATSGDGINFVARNEPLGRSYFRVFHWDGYAYAMARAGLMYRSRDGMTRFEAGPNPFAKGWIDPRVRHVAVHLEGHTLEVFYSRIGDIPERILLARIDLRRDWRSWRATRAAVVLEPEAEHEGALLPLRPSKGGLARGRVRELRDPAIFRERNRKYLLYSVAGENGLAMAELCGSS